MADPYAEPGQKPPDWLPRERRASATVDERLAMVTLQLSVMAQRLESIETKQGKQDVIAADLEQLVHGFRWMRTARIVIGWLIAAIVGSIATIKFLLPSLKELIK